MVIFLYGADDYRREAKKRDILAEFQKKRSDLGIGRFDLASLEGFAAFKEFLVSQSLFQPKKLAVLDSAFEADSKELSAILKEILESKDITVLISDKEKPVKMLEFLRKEPVLFQVFEFLEGKEWEDFIQKKAKELGVRLASTAVRFLAEVYQKNSWGLVTELQKLAGFGREVVEVKDLEELGVEQAPVFWSLIMGFKSRNLEQKLWALEKVLGSNEPPAKVFNILAYQLPDKLSDLAEYDLMVKSGKLEYEEALVDLVLK